MGNQNSQDGRKISTESAPGSDIGESGSVNPSPKKSADSSESLTKKAGEALKKKFVDNYDSLTKKSGEAFKKRSMENSESLTRKSGEAFKKRSMDNSDSLTKKAGEAFKKMSLGSSGPSPKKYFDNNESLTKKSGEAFRKKSLDNTPKKFGAGRFEIIPDPLNDKQRLRQPSGGGDNNNGTIAESRSPSPSRRPHSRHLSASQSPSPHVSHRLTSLQSPPDSNKKEAGSRTPRLGFKKFQVDFNFKNLSGKKSRRQSSEQEPLSMKCHEDPTPVIPREEIYEPASNSIDAFDLNSSMTSSSSGFRARATTISNGHAARLKTLVENQETFTSAKKDPEIVTKSRPSRRKKIPTVFRYMTPAEKGAKSGNKTSSKALANLPPTGPQRVFIAGSMNSWKAVEMIRTKGDAYFCVVIDCYEGDVFYKFCVDGEWKIDFSQEKVIGKENVLANIIRVKKSDSEVLEALACDSFIVKSLKPNQSQSKWGQVKPKWDSKTRPISTQGSSSAAKADAAGGVPDSQSPPFLPPQLLKSLLNKEVENSSDPNLLPEPVSHVMLNHLYAQSVKDNVLVMACTTRFRKKYATVVLYKPIN